MSRWLTIYCNVVRIISKARRADASKFLISTVASAIGIYTSSFYRWAEKGFG
jgi:hypothetical protein